MRQKEKRPAILYGLGGILVLAAAGAGLLMDAPRTDGEEHVAVKMAAPRSFREMERPDPVALLTPAPLPGRESPSR